MPIIIIRFGIQNVTKETKLKFTNDTVRAFVYANIPLQKLYHPAIREWLNEFMKASRGIIMSRRAGDVPNATILRSSYMNILKMEEESKIKEAVKDQAIVILCDETTNRKGECVFVVLFRILLASGEHKMLVAGTKVLNNADSTECSRAVVDSLLKYEVKCENVCSFVSDSAKYMGKCAEMLKLNLLGNIWSSELVALNECVVQTKVVFINTQKRKHHYLQHLQESNANPKLFPSLVVIRWNSWFHAVEYLDECLTHLVTFFKKKGSECSAAVKYFKQLEEDQMTVLKCQSKFILEGSSYPFAHKLHSKLSDVKTCFNDRVFEPETSCSLANPSCLKASTAAKLAATGQKCFLKLSSLVGADPVVVS
ncbi:hypothetical protein PR048_031951 [Dryococelus australis]|uniref:DUF4371 domain-containing protein n=1 Tax=Dryococelus australis TaxID=614101 RepID=A0ABQ9G7P7_9NEOP|nr:hypothetical protein PR048_031951 [Dryococelus australis]